MIQTLYMTHYLRYCRNLGQWSSDFLVSLQCLKGVKYLFSCISTYGIKCDFIYRVSQKNVLIECCWSHGAHCTGSITSGSGWHHLGLLRLNRIKRPQVMFMVKFSPTALNFGYDFVLLVHLFWDILYVGLFRQ